MIKLNIENCEFKKIKTKKIIKKMNSIANEIREKKIVGSEMMDWLDFAEKFSLNEKQNIENKVIDFNKKNVTKLLVVGIGGSFLGPKAILDMLKGKFESDEKLIFVGTDLSTQSYLDVEKKLENQNWGLCVISKSGSTLESAMAFRYFKEKLKDKYKDNYRDYIVSICDSKKGPLFEETKKEGYTTFPVPDGIGGRFSTISAVGLFPLAFAGVNIQSFLNGVAKGKEEYLLKNYENNISLQYAMMRFLLSRKKFAKINADSLFKKTKSKNIEIFTTYNSNFEMFLEWLKQLFGESEGKEEKGIFPTSAIFTRDLHSLGQFIQEGNKSFFETNILIEKLNQNINIPSSSENFDGFNDVVQKRSLNELNQIATKSVVKAHFESGKISNILITLEELNEFNIGKLIYFFFIAVTASCKLQNVNTFNQPGVEVYKSNLKTNLK